MTDVAKVFFIWIEEFTQRGLFWFSAAFKWSVVGCNVIPCGEMRSGWITLVLPPDATLCWLEHVSCELWILNVSCELWMWIVSVLRWTNQIKFLEIQGVVWLKTGQPYCKDFSTKKFSLPFLTQRKSPSHPVPLFLLNISHYTTTVLHLSEMAFFCFEHILRILLDFRNIQ